MEPIKDLNYIRSPPYPPPLLSVKLFGHIQQEARRGRKNKKVSAAGKKKTPATEKEALLNISWPISLAASGYGSRQPNTTLSVSLSRKRVWTCLKITEKVAFKILTSFWKPETWSNSVKGQGQFQDKSWWKIPKLKNPNATFWVISNNVK